MVALTTLLKLFRLLIKVEVSGEGVVEVILAGCERLQQRWACSLPSESACTSRPTEQCSRPLGALAPTA